MWRQTALSKATIEGLKQTLPASESLAQWEAEVVAILSGLSKVCLKGIVIACRYLRIALSCH